MKCRPFWVKYFYKKTTLLSCHTWQEVKDEKKKHLRDKVQKGHSFPPILLLWFMSGEQACKYMHALWLLYTLCPFLSALMSLPCHTELFRVQSLRYWKLRQWFSIGTIKPGPGGWGGGAHWPRKGIWGCAALKTPFSHLSQSSQRSYLRNP